MFSASPAPTIELRDYQAEAFSRIARGFEDDGRRSQLLVLPTGCGKTVVFGTVAKWVIEDVGGRVLILAHRGELLTQAADQLAHVGVETAVEKAEQNARGSLWDDSRCVVASVQTMRGKRLASWPRDYFKLVITDEAHHAPAESYGAIYKHFGDAWHLGVTATADRLDGENLGQVYECVAFEYSLREAIQNGHLSRLQIVRCETSVDLSSIRTTGGDMNQGDLEDAIRPYVEELANATKQEIGGRRAVVFTPDVGSAEAFASALTSIGVSAESISGKSKDRDEVLSGFRHGRFKVLCNCALLTEGFDAPFVSAIVLARPTKSRSLYAQMVGRGTRRFPTKQDCLIVDFAWLTGKHKLVSPIELFDTTSTPAEAQEIARELVDRGEATDLLDAIEKAETIQQDRQKFRVQAREREAKYRRVSFDPMAVFDVLGTPIRGESETSQMVKATDKQVQALKNFKVEGVEGISRRRATQMLDSLFSRAHQNLATHRQVAYLIRNGYDPAEARRITFKDASSILDKLFAPKRA